MIRIKYLLLLSGDAKTTHFTITKISEATSMHINARISQCTHAAWEWSLSLPMRTHIPLSTLSDRHHEGETSISRILRQTSIPQAALWRHAQHSTMEGPHAPTRVRTPADDAHPQNFRSSDIAPYGR